jgi:hypothetical protein
VHVSQVAGHLQVHMRRCTVYFPLHRARLIYSFCATGRSSKLLEESRMAARKNGSKTIPGFVSGITGGLLLIAIGAVEGVGLAKLELLKVETPATSKTAAPIAKTLRNLFRKVEWLIIEGSIA